MGGVIEKYDSKSEQWLQMRAAGEPPSGLYYGACATINGQFFVYGGVIKGLQMVDTLHCYNPATSKWRLLSCGGGPMKKGGSQMVQVDSQRLCVFGGYGDKGVTNEFHLFNINDGKLTDCTCTCSVVSLVVSSCANVFRNPTVYLDAV